MICDCWVCVFLFCYRSFILPNFNVTHHNTVILNDTGSSFYMLNLAKRTHTQLHLSMAEFLSTCINLSVSTKWARIKLPNQNGIFILPLMQKLEWFICFIEQVNIWKEFVLVNRYWNIFREIQKILFLEVKGLG